MVLGQAVVKGFALVARLKIVAGHEVGCAYRAVFVAYCFEDLEYLNYSEDQVDQADQD